MCWGLREPQSCWRNMPIRNSICYVICSVQLSRSVMSDSLQHHGLQHARAHCSSPTPGAWANSCPSSWWFHPTISSSVKLFCSSFQSFPVTGFFLKSQFFTSVGQSIGGSISASVLPMNIQDWFPLGWLEGSPCSPRDSQESCPTPEFKPINSSSLTILYGATVTSIRDNWKNHSFDYTELFQQNIASTFKTIV